MLLVAGSAALADLIAQVDRVPAAHEVAQLLPSPAAEGRWLPGGTAPVVALAAAAAGASVRLWHPLPASPTAAADVSQLQRAGIDLGGCPTTTGLARCILLTAADSGERLCWSVAAPDPDLDHPDALLDAVDLVAICPQWGRWADSLAGAAAQQNIDLALIGGFPPPAARYPWAYAIADDRQCEQASGRFSALVTVVTRGADGCTVIDRGATTPIPAAAVRAVDTTGAGDTFAGCFLGHLLAGADPRAAARSAAQAAATACLQWGARPTGLLPAGPRHPGPQPGGTPRTRPPGGLLERARGALACLAYGDALGMPNSFLPSPAIRTGMEPAPADSPYHAGYLAGQITDDTQQALAISKSIERSAGPLDPRLVAEELLAWFDSVGGEGSLAVGPSTMRALVALRAGQNLEKAGLTGVTNGAAMRIAPVGVWAALKGFDEARIVQEVAAACLPTHHTSMAISGACAIAAAVASGVAGHSWDDSVDAACRCADRGAQLGRWVYSPSVSARTRWAAQQAREVTSQDRAITLISELIGAGEPVTESVPAAFAAVTYAHCDPRRAILLAANCRGDTDTIAAMAGALSGAHSGAAAIPPQWSQLVADVNQLDVGSWVATLDGAADAVTGPPPERQRPPTGTSYQDQR